MFYKTILRFDARYCVLAIFPCPRLVFIKLTWQIWIGDRISVNHSKLKMVTTTNKTVLNDGMNNAKRKLKVEYDITQSFEVIFLISWWHGHNLSKHHFIDINFQSTDKYQQLNLTLSYVSKHANSINIFIPLQYVRILSNGTPKILL